MNESDSGRRDGATGRGGGDGGGDGDGDGDGAAGVGGDPGGGSGGGLAALRDRAGWWAARLLAQEPPGALSPDLGDGEAAVVEALDRAGWEVVGTGTTRVVARPPAALRDRVAAGRRGGFDAVVKFARPHPPEVPATQRGTGQNRAERRVWALLADEGRAPARPADADSESLAGLSPPDGVNRDWFAEVYAAGRSRPDAPAGADAGAGAGADADAAPAAAPVPAGAPAVADAWVAVERLPPLPDTYPDAPDRRVEDAAGGLRGAAQAAGIRVDAGVDNIGVRVRDPADAPPLDGLADADVGPRAADWLAHLDYGIPNWPGWTPAAPDADLPAHTDPS